MSSDMRVSPGVSESRCTVCESGKLVFFEKKLNISGSMDDMYICDECHVITNYSKRGQDLALQEQGLNNVYRFTEEEIKKIPEDIEARKGIINTVLPFVEDYHHKTILEIGMGRGYTVLSASELGFKNVIGIDLNLTLFKETLRHFKPKAAVAMYTDISEVKEKVDCVVMWHTLEHIYLPNVFLYKLKPVMNDGCVLYFQVPQYYQPYICDTHHHFYNESSARALLERNGFKVLECLYDVTLQFFTVIAKYGA